MLIGLAVATVLAGIILAAVVVADDDDDTATTTTTTTTSASTTTTMASTTTAGGPTTTAAAPGDIDLALYPDLRGTSRFDDPRQLVSAFATQYLAFDTDVVVGQFRQGDNRSGEVEVHPPGSTAITTILVRQVGDDSWVVVAATTDSIRLDTPLARTRISSPQPLIGAASAYEGHVDVAVYADGQNAPAGTTFVTGRGDGQLGDFRGQLTFTRPEGATHGLLVLTSANGDDGTSVAAAAIRVRF